MIAYYYEGEEKAVLLFERSSFNKKEGFSVEYLDGQIVFILDKEIIDFLDKHSVEYLKKCYIKVSWEYINGNIISESDLNNWSFYKYNLQKIAEYDSQTGQVQIEGSLPRTPDISYKY